VHEIRFEGRHAEVDRNPTCPKTDPIGDHPGKNNPDRIQEEMETPEKLKGFP
jgi:hypothetical protein